MPALLRLPAWPCLAIALLFSWPSSAHHIIRDITLTSPKISRALKVATWLWNRNKPKQPILPKGMPLLLLARWLPAIAQVGRRDVLQAFNRAALQAGYPKQTPQLYLQWSEEWRQVLLAYDAKRWKISPKQLPALQAKLRALPKKGLTDAQKRVRAALHYKIRLCRVSSRDRAAVTQQKQAILAFLKLVWRKS